MRRDAFVVSHLPEGGTVLNLGCCGGRDNDASTWDWTLHAKMRHHHGLVGADMSRKALKAMDKLGFDVRHVDLEDPPYDLNTYNCIVMGEVIEHLSNPGQCLRRLRLHLHDDGVLILTTPNVYGFWRWVCAGLGMKAWHADHDHAMLHSRETICNLLRAARWHVETVEYLHQETWPGRRWRAAKAVPEMLRRLRPNMGVVARKEGV